MASGEQPIPPDSSPSTPGKRAPGPGAPETDYTRWGVEETCRYLRAEGLGEWEAAFREQRITGVGLGSLTDADLENFGLKLLGDRLRVLHSLRKLWQAGPSKVFNDPIHGHIEFPLLLIRIIDTPQFQRLRHIKQLGGAYFVFPGASHNRFEHSLGVGHLAGELVRALKRRQPELKINDRDILCVQIAGLCHDLGHGPFSHMFDGEFIPKARPGHTWKHEDASVAMFNHLVADNDLEPVMSKHGLVLPDDLDFIKEQITRPMDQKDLKETKWPYRGRPKDKSFLYEIVSNKRNGIDVDKWDYFARDCHHLGIKNNFDSGRFLMFARVCEVEGQKQICTRDQEVGNLYDMFHTRSGLHRRAYQHKVSNIVQTMITEAFLKADKHIEFEGSGGKMFSLSEAIDDMKAYTKVTDHVFEQILNSSSADLKDSREILKNVVCRRLPKCLGETQTTQDTNVSQEEIAKWKIDLAKCDSQEVVLDPEDIIIDVIHLDYGMKEKDPIKSVRFYSKNDPSKAVKIREDQEPLFLPEKFANKLIRVYCRKRDSETVDAAMKTFVNWCLDKNFSTPQDGNTLAPELTPVKPILQNDDKKEVGKARIRLFES
ncbi:deoxynucleoside triphosphate triphosphohydrolase SAMHD1 [Spinachia spinachia]